MLVAAELALSLLRWHRSSSSARFLVELIGEIHILLPYLPLISDRPTTLLETSL
jgi:hypothetical protein